MIGMMCVVHFTSPTKCNNTIKAELNGIITTQHYDSEIWTKRMQRCSSDDSDASHCDHTFRYSVSVSCCDSFIFHIYKKKKKEAFNKPLQAPSPSQGENSVTAMSTRIQTYGQFRITGIVFSAGLSIFHLLFRNNIYLVSIGVKKKKNTLTPMTVASVRIRLLSWYFAVTAGVFVRADSLLRYVDQ